MRNKKNRHETECIFSLSASIDTNIGFRRGGIQRPAVEVITYLCLEGNCYATAYLAHLWNKQPAMPLCTATY